MATHPKIHSKNVIGFLKICSVKNALRGKTHTQKKTFVIMEQKCVQWRVKIYLYAIFETWM